VLDILVIMTLARVLGAHVKAKGLNKFPYQLLLWVLLIGGQVFGGVLGVLIHSVLESGERVDEMFVYFCALVGGIIGIVIAFVVAHRARPADHLEPWEHDEPAEARTHQKGDEVIDLPVTQGDERDS
jgi:hypothetical protein